MIDEVQRREEIKNDSRKQEAKRTRVDLDGLLGRVDSLPDLDFCPEDES
jgi:hypothetical protein